jgi:ubiquinol-cytochrome c reductase iron-sulfur subunit
MHASGHDVSPGGSGEISRRDFLYIATGAFAGVGTLATAWPFIDQMNPSADTLAAGSPVTIDLSKIAPGQQIIIQWRSTPIFIVHRTAPALAGLRQQALLSRLSDPDSDEFQQPDYAKNWSRSLKPDYLVLVGICTHLGCIPRYQSQPEGGGIESQWPEGYLCPCHGSRYDLAGRVFRGMPAPLNLPVPPYHFSGETSLIVGENPPGSSFEMSSVEQM